jgi:hypothetical protein
MAVPHRSPALLVCVALLLASLVAVPAVLSVGTSPAGAGGATLYPITTTADVVDAGDGLLSLREAITSANTDLLAFGSTFQLVDGATYRLTRCGGGLDEQANVGGDLDMITPEATTVEGGGAIVQTCPGERVIDARAATAELTVTGASISGGETALSGGGLRVAGDLTLFVNADVHHNRALTGGGVRVDGELFASVATVRDNVASGDGGGIRANGGPVTIQYSSISGNRSGGSGGGLSVDGPANVIASTVSQNEAGTAGGGVATTGTTGIDTSTLVANRAPDAANLRSPGSTTVASSIISMGSGGDDCDVPFPVAPSGGADNVGGDASCGFTGTTDLSGVHPQLGPLAVPPNATLRTASRAPVGPSAVVDHDAAPCSGTPSDQHDIARPTGSACNSGADERKPQVCSQAFPDVGAAHPFVEEICWLSQMGITGGFSDGRFKPGQAVSRQAMAAFLYRLALAPAFTPPPIRTFADVGPTHPFLREVEWMADTGIASSLEDTFRPQAPVSRQAMAAFIYRVAGEPPTVPLGQPFVDVPPSHPFFVEIAWLTDNGVADGFIDGTYRPSTAVSRQAMAAFMQRVADGNLIGGL